MMTVRSPRQRACLLSLLAALAAIVALGGCQRTAAPLHQFGPAPWADGELTLYDSLREGGALRGYVSFALGRTPQGYNLTYQSFAVRSSYRAQVSMSSELLPQRSVVLSGPQKSVVTWGDRIEVQTSVGKKPQPPASFASSTGLLDINQMRQVIRALPLALGYETELAVFNPRVGDKAMVAVKVIGQQRISVPAGSFTTWYVRTSIDGQRRDAWYAQGPERLLVKYHNRGSGTQWLLRAYKLGRDGPWTGERQPAFDPKSQPYGPATNTSVLALVALVQLPLMILFPLCLAWVLRKRWAVPWRVWAVGAATFVVAQLVHIPLNRLLGSWGLFASLRLLPVAVALGLSAALCEEIARYGALRLIRKHCRNWPSAVVFGLGHGGIESVIFGGLVGWTLISVLFATSSNPARAAAMASTAAELWTAPWYLPVMSAVERLAAIAFHLAATVLVMRAVQSRAPVYLAAAIGLHTALNAGMYYLKQTHGTVVSEGYIVAFGAVMLLLLWTLRTKLQNPADSGPAPPRAIAAGVAGQSDPS